MRRGLIVIVVLAAAALGYLGAGWSARPRVLYVTAAPVLTPPLGGRRWVAWLEGDGKQRRLMAVPRSGRRPRAVIKDASLSALCVTGDSAYVTRMTSRGAELTSISLPDGRMQAVSELPEMADAIVCSDKWIAWSRRREPALAGVPFVAAGAPVIVIRARLTSAGPVRVAAVVSVDEEAGQRGFGLLGIAGDRVYWVERSASSDRTWVRSAPCNGGSAETLADEKGARSAALEGEVLAWTGPSREAGGTQAFESVTRMNLRDGRSALIGDWLGRQGQVMLSRGTCYVEERGGLWRLGSERGEQERIYKWQIGMRSSRVIGDEEFMFLGGVGGSALTKRPLGMWSSIRSAAGQ